MSEHSLKKVSLSDYLQKKERLLSDKQQAMSSLNAPCIHCFRPHGYCLCSMVVPVETKNKIVILMHPKEAKRERVGTGRLTHLSLPNSKLLVGDNFHQDQDLQALLNDPNFQSVLLYPGQKSFSLGQGDLPIKFREKRMQIFVLDGTWPCARSMMRDTPELHDLPRISFQHKQISQFSIKQQPHPACLSTIESVTLTLELLEQMGLESLNGKQHSMIKLLQHIVTFQQDCARDPNRRRYRRFSEQGHKPQELRTPSKRWKNRNIFFDGQ